MKGTFLLSPLGVVCIEHYSIIKSHLEAIKRGVFIDSMGNQLNFDDSLLTADERIKQLYDKIYGKISSDRKRAIEDELSAKYENRLQSSIDDFF